MSNKVPVKIAKEIKDRVFEEADRRHYLARSRQDNGKFLDQLVLKEDVGGLLSKYIKKSEVRTYIKDAILNRYSKDKILAERPRDFAPIIEENFNLEACLLERENKSNVSLFKSSNNHSYVVVADGTYLKWETALRKALLYIASKPFSSKADCEIHILLSLFARHQKICPSNRKQLRKALEKCDAKAYIYGEG